MNKSFTLIEILVVIVVIGVLSAFILVGMSSITSSANIAKGKAFLNSMDNSMLLGRVSQWKFDETSGATAYDSWGTNNGTLTGGATIPLIQTTGCVSNNCLYFDGTDDVVSMGTVPTMHLGAASFSISCWFNKSRTAEGSLVTKLASLNSNGTGISATATKIWLYWNVSDYAELFYTINLNQWYSVVWTYNDTTKKSNVYINGIVMDVDRSMNITYDPTDRNLRIGNAGGYLHQGTIDDVRIYNQAIPTSQIEQNYVAGLNRLLVKNSMSKAEYVLNLAQTLDQNAKF